MVSRMKMKWWMGVDDRPSKQSFRGKRGSAKKSPSASAAGREKCTVAQLGSLTGDNGHGQDACRWWASYLILGPKGDRWIR
jgi:hypothetical protein